MKKAASHVGAVAKRMIFIGFTIQIGLGILWMGCNFMENQDFGEPDSALYRGLFGLCGENPCLLYLLQLALAFYAGYRLLGKLGSFGTGRGQRERMGFRIWGSLALLTLPFAMQCHLAVQPHSLMGSFFLLMISFLLDLFGFSGRGLPGILSGISGKVFHKALPADSEPVVIERKRRLGRLRALFIAAACLMVMVALSGAADAERLENGWKHNIQAALASRLAWPDIWNDVGYWPEDLREMTGDVMWETSHYPCNMDILLKTIADEVGDEAAKDYYLLIAKTGWRNHAYMVVRQIGWDIVGYAVTPVVFQLQLEGEAYDSFTGRNYEIMRENAPVLTRYYVDYGCWWFCCCLVLTFCMAFTRILVKGAAGWRRWLAAVGICVSTSVVLICLLTMRGAGLMDYKYTVAVNELWLAAGVWLVSEKSS